MRRHRLHPVIASVALAVAWLLAACGSSAPAESGATEPTSPAASVAASTPASESASPLEGIWRTDLTRDQIHANLEKFGLEKWSDQFFLTEDFDDATSWVWVFEGDRFAGYSLLADGSWRVGWWGTLTIDGDEVNLVNTEDEDQHVTDTFRYAIKGDELTLTFVRTDAAEQVEDNPEEVFPREIPSEAYVRAYFTQPLKRATCPPEAEPCHA